MLKQVKRELAEEAAAKLAEAESKANVEIDSSKDGAVKKKRKDKKPKTKKVPDVVDVGDAKVSTSISKQSKPDGLENMTVKGKSIKKVQRQGPIKRKQSKT